MEGELVDGYAKVPSKKVKNVLRKAWIIIAAFIIGFGVPLVIFTFISTGGNFWAAYIRVWAIAGMIIGFLLGIPTGMVIFGKFLFSRSKL